MITFQKLKIGYTSNLATVQLQPLRSGTLYALIGSNGSGKSTFLKTLSGVLSPFSGTFSVHHQNCHLWNSKQRSRIVAFVPAQFPITDFMTSLQFVSLGQTPYLNHFGQLNGTQRALVDRVFEQLQITQLKNHYTHQLSDGQRQLCAIARAIVQQTKLILLDEPTSFLDFRNKRKIISTLQQIAQEKKICILFSSHDIETIFPHKNIQLLGINHVKKPAVIENIDRNMPFESIIDRYYSESLLSD